MSEKKSISGIQLAREIQHALDNIYEHPYFTRSRFEDIGVIWNVYKMIDDNFGKRPVQVGGMAVTYQDLDMGIPFSHYEHVIESLRKQIEAYEQEKGMAP